MSFLDDLKFSIFCVSFSSTKCKESREESWFFGSYFLVSFSARRDDVLGSDTEVKRPPDAKPDDFGSGFN